MSEEIKSLKNYISTTKNEIFTTFKIETISNLIIYYVDLQQKVDRLNNIIDTMLEFSFFKEECPLNFGFGDKKEEKAQDVFYEDDYCEENCNDIYKKCWMKYFEKLQELKENNK